MVDLGGPRDDRVTYGIDFFLGDLRFFFFLLVLLWLLVSVVFGILGAHPITSITKENTSITKATTSITKESTSITKKNTSITKENTSIAKENSITWKNTRSHA